MRVTIVPDYQIKQRESQQIIIKISHDINRSTRVQFLSSFTGQSFTEYPPVLGTVLDTRQTAVNTTGKKITARTELTFSGRKETTNKTDQYVK